MKRFVGRLAPICRVEQPSFLFFRFLKKMFTTTTLVYHTEGQCGCSDGAHSTYTRGNNISNRGHCRAAIIAKAVVGNPSIPRARVRVKRLPLVLITRRPATT